MTTLAQDTFVRANQAGWGTASDGTNTWGSPIGPGTASIASNEGTMVGTGGGGDVHMVLGSLTPTNINMLIRTKTTNAGGDLNGLLWRWTTATSNGYRCGFFGGTTFNVDKYTSGSRANIANFSFSYTSNSFYWIRLIHTSVGTLQIRVWADGSSEPGTWNLNTTETTYASGNFGTSTFVSSIDTISFDSLTVTDNQTLSNLATEAQATFKIRVPLATNARDTFKVRAVLANQARATWKIKAVLATLSRATFKIDNVLKSLATSAQATFKIKLGAVLTWITRDNQANWTARDNDATWAARDNETTWKARD